MNRITTIGFTAAIIIVSASKVNAFYSLPTINSTTRRSSPFKYSTHSIPTTTSQLFQVNNDETNNNNDETPQQLSQRMELVRQVQKTFYQNEDPIQSAPMPNSTVLENVPLWRVQWVEYPGSQNVLNVHVPHYTNMFQKIIHAPGGTKKYFGHLYLPGGSQNLDNEEYALNTHHDNENENSGSSSSSQAASLTGVLMEITDWKQLDDGRLVLIVQALEKFKVVKAIRSHSPYAIANVEICPDDEFVATHANANEAVSKVFDLHNYEYKTVTMEECAVNKDQIQDGISVSPLSNYDYKLVNSDLSVSSTTAASASATATPTTIPTSSILMEETEQFRLDETEYRVWVKLDQMIQLLQTAVGTNGSVHVPIPSQILGLLPRTPYQPWPINFQLETFASKLQSQGTMVGTFSSSPFVRVQDNKSYSHLRRTSRLSFVIWTLVDSIVIGEEEAEEQQQGFNSRQRILELSSTTQRLRLAESKLDVICAMLQRMLN